MNDVNKVARVLGLDDRQASWLALLGRQEGQSLSSEINVSDLLSRFGLDPQDASALLDEIQKARAVQEYWWLLERSHWLLVRSFMSRYSSAVWKPAPSLPANLSLFPVLVIALSGDSICGHHEAIGVPKDISSETLSVVGGLMRCFRSKHDKPGIELSDWDCLRFCAWLYQVGRLEVTPYWIKAHPEAAGPLFWYDEMTANEMPRGFQKGSLALGLHVPASIPLLPDACDEALARLRRSFDKLDPAGPPVLATCTSWLLDEQLTNYLPKESNILSFQRRFHLVPGTRDNDDWIMNSAFGRERTEKLSDLPISTELQRAVVSHLESGNHWRLRTGWIRLR